MDPCIQVNHFNKEKARKNKQKNRVLKYSLQDHWELASRKDAMARAIRRNDKVSDEQRLAASDLEKQAFEHQRQARIHGASFLMVLR